MRKDNVLRVVECSFDGARIIAASSDKTTRIWEVRFATMPPVADLVKEVCLRRLRWRTALSRDDMRPVGCADGVPVLDVCAGD